MALQYSQFVYGFEIIAGTNDKLDWVDTGSTYETTLEAGVYLAAELAAHIQTQMQADGTGTETCTFSFSTLKFTLGGTATFSLLWNTGTNAGQTPGGILGFDETADDTGATSYTSDAAVGTSPSTANLWTAAEPNVNAVSPVTAQTDGTAALLLQRRVLANQNVTDGGFVETNYINTRKVVQIEFRELTSAEQTKMETLADWIEAGKRINWQPDKTSTNALRLVLLNPGDINNTLDWLTRSEASYGVLTFLEQLTRE